MLVKLELDTDRLGNNIRQSLENLRINHIDANLVIQEELNQLLPQYIKDIVENLYNEVIMQ